MPKQLWLTTIKMKVKRLSHNNTNQLKCQTLLKDFKINLCKINLLYFWIVILTIKTTAVLCMDSRRKCLCKLCKIPMILVRICLTKKLDKDYFLSLIKKVQETREIIMIKWSVNILAVRVYNWLSQYKLKVNQLHLRMMLLLLMNSLLLRRPPLIRETFIPRLITILVISTGHHLLKQEIKLLVALSHLPLRNSLHWS
jgi:hypothetical protein